MTGELGAREAIPFARNVGSGLRIPRSRWAGLFLWLCGHGARDPLLERGLGLPMSGPMRSGRVVRAMAETALRRRLWR